MKEKTIKKLTQVFFSDEKTIYLENHRGFKWIHNEDENFIEVKRRRGKKLNIKGVISYDGKFSLEIFEDNLSSENYIQILS